MRFTVYHLSASFLSNYVVVRKGKSFCNVSRTICTVQ